MTNSVQFILRVLYLLTDKPSRPVGPLEPIEVRANHITVQWTQPEDNGGSEITGYVIEKMDMDTGRWVPAGEVSLSKLIHILILGKDIGISKTLRDTVLLF